jgi:hypothetical protein
MPAQLGQYVTQFPGETVDDLLLAIRDRATRAVVRPARARVPAEVYGLQSIYSWLLPFQSVPLVKRARAKLLHRARAVIARRAAEESAAAPIEQAPELVAGTE